MIIYRITIPTQTHKEPIKKKETPGESNSFRALKVCGCPSCRELRRLVRRNKIKLIFL